MVIFEDETTEFRLEQTILKAEKLAVVGHLALGSLIEIRNPLTSARGFCQLIEEPTKNQKDYIEIISKELAQIQDIVENCSTAVEPVKYNNLEIIYQRFWVYIRNKIDSYQLIMVSNENEKITFGFSEENINIILKVMDLLNIWVEDNTYILNIELIHESKHINFNIKSTFDKNDDLVNSVNLIKTINRLKFKNNRIDIQVINNNTISININFPIISSNIKKPHLIAK
jgi:signal transduction histidine kinase